MQAGELVESLAAADFQSAVIFFHRFGQGVRGFLRCPLEQGEEVADRIGQQRLVVLDRQNVIGAPIPDRLGDVGLGAHGIDGDDAACQRQHREQLRNRRLLVGFSGGRPLAQEQAGPRSEGADQMQRCGKGADFLTILLVTFCHV